MVLHFLYGLENELDYIQQSANRAIFRHCGFWKGTSRPILYGPSEFGGEEVDNRIDCQGVGQLQMLLKHCRVSGVPHSLTGISLSWWQWVAGTSTPIPEDHQCLPHLDTKSKWFTAVCQYLIRTGATVEVAQPHVPPLQRVNDAYIMDLVLPARTKNDKPKFSSTDICYINWVRLHLHHSNCPFRQALADLITIAFFFLLHPGEYTGTTTDDAAFTIEDVLLYLDQEKLDIYTSTLWKMENATSVRYIFTTQKNGCRGDIISHTCSGHDLCCPVRATIRRILHHRIQNSTGMTVFASCYHNNRRHILRAKDVTDEFKSAVDITSSETGLHPKDVSARSLRAGGAMALLCGNIDSDLIKLLGRWHSDAMMRYLHQ